MTEKKKEEEMVNPFPEKQLDKKKYDRYRENFEALACNLNMYYPEAMRSGIPLEQIKCFKTEDDLRAFISDSKAKYLQQFQFVPTDERLRISENFERVFNDYHRSIMSVAGCYNATHVVIEDDPNGMPRVNVDKSMKAAEADCFRAIDNEKLLRLYNALKEFYGSFQKFSDAVENEKDGVRLLDYGTVLWTEAGQYSLESIAEVIVKEYRHINLENFASRLFSSFVVRH